MLEKLDTLPRILFLSCFSCVFPASAALFFSPLSYITLCPSLNSICCIYQDGCYLRCKAPPALAYSGLYELLAARLLLQARLDLGSSTQKFGQIHSTRTHRAYSSVPVTTQRYFNLPEITTLLNVFHFLSNLGFFNMKYKTLIFLLHPTREKKHHLL